MTVRTACIAAIGLAAATSPPAQAATVDVPSRAEITGLGGNPTGLSAAVAGDVNGDGLLDVVAGTPGADVLGRGDAGTAYVVFGAAGKERTDIRHLGSRGFQISGPRTFLRADLIDDEVTGDGAGTSVAGVGDVNGDGLDDIAVSAPASGAGLRDSAGSVYVIFGTRNPAPVDLARLGPAGYRIDGDRVGDELGGVARLGDTDGDGLDDVGVTAARSGAYVVRGQRATATVDLRAPGGRASRLRRTTGKATEYGTVVLAAAGDTNDDGLADVALGDPAASPRGRRGAGTVWVIRGSAQAGTVTLDGRDPRTRRFDGPRARTSLGAAVALAGDMDGDGTADLIAGRGRRAYALYGGTGPDVDLARAGRAATAIRAPGGTIAFGSEVAGPGDLDADGRPDAALGAPGTDRGCRTDSGAVYVVRGGPRRRSISLARPSKAWYRVVGTRPGENVGAVLGGGAGQLVVGAPGTEPQQRYTVAMVDRVRKRDSITTVAGRCLRVTSDASSGSRVAATGRLPVTVAVREARPLFDTVDLQARLIRPGRDVALRYATAYLGRVPARIRVEVRLSRRARAILWSNPRARIVVTASQEALGNTRRVRTTVQLR